MIINKSLLKKEIKSVERGKEEEGKPVNFDKVYSTIASAKNKDLQKQRERIAQVLVEHNLKYFAVKVMNGGYDIEEISGTIEEN